MGAAFFLLPLPIIGSLYPWVIQRFQVDLSARSLEAPYIERNIDLTRDAYGVEDIETIPFEAKTDAEPGALRSDAATTANIRLMDPLVISPAFQQLQQFRQYYQFPDALDVDRYDIDGTTQDTVVAVRDLYDMESALAAGRLWQRLHLLLTAHGLAAQPLNQPIKLGDRDVALGRPSAVRGQLDNIMDAEGWQATLLFRAGYPIDPSTASPRRGLEDVTMA